MFIALLFFQLLGYHESVRGLCFACLSVRDNRKSSCSKQEGFQGKQFYKESVLFDAITGYYGAANDSRVITTT